MPGRDACIVRRILAPLDGSRLAEAVLPSLIALATRFGAEVALLHVLEERPPATIHGEAHLADLQAAEGYLQRAASRLADAGVSVELHAHETREGSVAGSIVQHAVEMAPDLVVLCAHGSGGLRDLFIGRIAQQVLQRGAWPILMLQPAADGSPVPFELSDILSPVDGEHDQSGALRLASALACAFGATLHLALAVPTPETLADARRRTGITLPRTMRAILDLAEEGAARDLAAMAAPCAQRGATVRTTVLRGETVASLTGYADQIEAGLVVLATHGSTGIEAIVEASVAPRMAARLGRPILFVKEA
jgi:nucleotide-binding universal stress UspA family protein